MAKLDDDINELFKTPLTEFITARKTLSARLKKSGFASEAEGVKTLAKPSISAWTVNQLYWRHREEFDELIATAQRFRKAQTSGKMVNMREALDARREALSQLSDLASAILHDAGNNPSLDTLRRISTTLEALSAYASQSDGPTPGRLTQDIDPPGFDSFASFVPGAATTTRATAAPRVSPPTKTVASSGKSADKTKAAVEARRERQARLNAAKLSLQHAKKALTAARASAQSLAAAQKMADANAKEAEKTRREAEERFQKANAAAAAAAHRARSIAVESAEAGRALADAKRAVEQSARELEACFRETPGAGRK